MKDWDLLLAVVVCLLAYLSPPIQYVARTMHLCGYLAGPWLLPFRIAAVSSTSGELFFHTRTFGCFLIRSMPSFPNPQELCTIGPRSEQGDVQACCR